MKKRSIFAATAASLLLAAGANAAVTHTFDLSGMPSDGGFFDAFPTLTHNFGVAGNVVFIEFNLNLTATDPSWVSEAIIFVDGASDGLGDFEAWISADYGAPDAPGFFQYAGSMVVDIESPAGFVAVTCAEAFSDAPTPDAVYGAGSSVTVHFEAVPAPGAMALVGAAGAVSIRRRRR